MNSNILDWIYDKVILIYDRTSEWLSEHFVKILLSLLIGYFIYHIGLVLLSLTMRIVTKASSNQNLAKKDIEKRTRTLISITSAVWKSLAVIIIGITICSEIFPSVSFSALIASLGVVGVAIGFGSQSLVKDFLSGIFIISENQYRVGDIVEISGAVGKVERISTRATIIRDLDGNVHFIPNGSITHVINKTMGYSSVHFDVKIHYDNDIKKATDIINSVGAKLAKDAKWQAKILNPPCVDRISDFSGNAVTVTVIGKTLPSEQWDVTSEIRLRLIQEFQKHDIKIPVAATTASKPKA